MDIQEGPWIGQVALDQTRQAQKNRMRYLAVRQMNAYAHEFDELSRLGRLLDRKALQGLGLSESQQERFNEILRGIDRRFSDVMARRG